MIGVAGLGLKLGAGCTGKLPPGTVDPGKVVPGCRLGRVSAGTNVPPGPSRVGGGGTVGLAGPDGIGVTIDPGVLGITFVGAGTVGITTFGCTG